MRDTHKINKAQKKKEEEPKGVRGVGCMSPLTLAVINWDKKKKQTPTATHTHNTQQSKQGEYIHT
jgi:hypothetical protein